MKVLTFTILLSLSVFVVAGQTPAPKKAATPAAAKPAAPKTAAPKTAAPAKAAPAKPAAGAKPVVAQAAGDNPVVITVGDSKITKKEYEGIVAALPEQVRAQAAGPNKRRFAEQLAEMKTLAYEARRRKLESDPEIQARLALQMDNILASELYRTLTANLKADEAAVQGYYNDHKSEYEEVQARHILIRFKGSQVPATDPAKELTEEEALAKAKEIREKIVKGGDFAELAKAESADTGSGANGGSLGSFGRGQMVPPFEQAAFALPVGQISEPVKSQFGWHIIKVEAHGSKKFEEVKAQIEAKMKQDLAKKAVEDVKKAIPITIDDSYFGK